MPKFWSEERNLTVLLGIIIFDFFVLPSLTSLIGERIIINLLNNLVISLLMLTGLFALTGNKARHKAVRTLFTAIVALVISVRWSRLIFEARWLAGWDILLTFVSFLAFAVVVLGHVYKEGPMTSHRIQGAVAAYLLIAMTFALAYFLVEFIVPSSFQLGNLPMRLDEQSWRVFHYFSISTLTTVGYGDITPVQPVARNLAMAEALIGQLYPAILLARLVSLHIQSGHSKKSD